MSRISSARNLPHILEDISRYKLEGVINCHFDLGEPLQMFFKGGELVHVSQSTNSHSPDVLLDYMLKWVMFNVEWQNVKVQANQSNVTPALRTILAEDLQRLIKDGLFFKPGQSNFDPSFFDLPLPAVTTPVPVPEIPQPKEENSPVGFSKPTTTPNDDKNLPSVSNAPGYTIEANLILPPGTRQEQLEELMLPLGLKEQIQILERFRFSGVIYYRLGAGLTIESRHHYGLVLVVEGNLTDVKYYSGAQKSTKSGTEAYQFISKVKATPEVYKVDTRILKAYRGLISTQEPSQSLKATNQNFTRILKAFEQSRRDGVVLLNLDRLKLHYLFLFEKGVRLGVFGTDANSGKLQPLTAPLALPTNEDTAQLTVLLATSLKTYKLWEGTGLVNPLQTEPTSEEASTEEVESVDWNGSPFDFSAVLEKPVRQTPKSSRGKPVDHDNPYDF